MFKKAFYIVFGMTLLGANGYALDWDWSPHLSLTAGYRHDKIDCLINSFDPPGTFLFSDQLTAKNLNVYELGVKGNIGFCDNWFLKGFADFGQLKSGSYTETVSAPGFTDDIFRAKAHNGITRDFSIGLGYALPCWEYFSFAPIIGYSYDYQKFKLHDTTFDGLPDPVVDGLKYENRWQGPWIGCEAQFALQCVDFSLGYEYHWSHWHANWELKGADEVGGAFSDKRNSHHANGNVVYLDSAYSFCDCWDIGLGFKYQFWRATHGKEVPRGGSFAEIGLSPTEEDKVHQATWYSYQVQLSIGHYF